MKANLSIFQLNLISFALLLDRTIRALSYNYSITVKHGSHLEATTASPVSFSVVFAGFNFTDNISKTFGENMKDTIGVSVIYSGDITLNGNDYPCTTAISDGIIDIANIYSIFASYFNGDYGYISSYSQ